MMKKETFICEKKVSDRAFKKCKRLMMKFKKQIVKTGCAAFNVWYSSPEYMKDKRDEEGPHDNDHSTILRLIDINNNNTLHFVVWERE